MKKIKLWKSSVIASGSYSHMTTLLEKAQKTNATKLLYFHLEGSPHGWNLVSVPIHLQEETIRDTEEFFIDDDGDPS